MNKFIPLLVYVVAIMVVSGCLDKLALAESSFGKLGKASSKASPTSAISMGRDDDDGQAKKWHIGGGWR